MKRVKMTKEERKTKRKEFLIKWHGMTDAEKQEVIKANKTKHAKIFQENKKNRTTLALRQKAGSEVLETYKAILFDKTCPLYTVVKPAQRDKKTGEILHPARLKREHNSTFTVTLAARIVKGKNNNNCQRIHVAFTIRSLKDTDNLKTARMHLGERMDLGSRFSFEFNTIIPLDNDYDIKWLCWAEFDSYIRRPDTSLSARFIRSWNYKSIEDFY